MCMLGKGAEKRKCNILQWTNMNDRTLRKYSLSKVFPYFRCIKEKWYLASWLHEYIIFTNILPSILNMMFLPNTENGQIIKQIINTTRILFSCYVLISKNNSNLFEQGGIEVQELRWYKTMFYFLACACHIMSESFKMLDMAHDYIVLHWKPCICDNFWCVCQTEE